MRRLIFGLVLAVPLALAPAVHAQERTGPGRVEIGAFPAGGIFFTNSSSQAEPDFDNFALGVTVTYHVNRWIAVEGEVGQALGLTQPMRAGNVPAAEHRSPTLYAYSGSLLVNPTGSAAAVVPYLAGGIGGMTFFGNDDDGPFAFDETTTYLTVNAGGGTKWYFAERWGLRADYRLIVVDNKASAPQFFGRDNVRYGHRVYGGLLFNF